MYKRLCTKDFLCNTVTAEEFQSDTSAESDTHYPLLPLQNEYFDSPQTDKPPQLNFDQQDSSKSFEAYSLFAHGFFENFKNGNFKYFLVHSNFIPPP